MNPNIEYRIEGEYFSYDDLKRALMRLEKEGFTRSDILILTKSNHPKLDKIHSLSRVDVYGITPLPEEPSFLGKIIDAITVDESEMDVEPRSLLNFGIGIKTARRFNEGLKNNSALILVDTKAPNHFSNDSISHVNQKIFDQLQ